MRFTKYATDSGLRHCVFIYLLIAHLVYILLVEMSSVMRNKIREYREKLGLSQTQLAQKISLAPGNLSNLENGKRNPWPKVRRDLARVLGATEKKLFPDGGESER